MERYLALKRETRHLRALDNLCTYQGTILSKHDSLGFGTVQKTTCTRKHIILTYNNIYTVYKVTTEGRTQKIEKTKEQQRILKQQLIQDYKVQLKLFSLNVAFSMLAPVMIKTGIKIYLCTCRCQRTSYG